MLPAVVAAARSIAYGGVFGSLYAPVIYAEHGVCSSSPVTYKEAS
jgi:hypothetical protein